MKFKIKKKILFVFCLGIIVCSCNYNIKKDSAKIETNQTENREMEQIYNYLKLSTESEITTEEIKIVKDVIFKTLKNNNFNIQEKGAFQEQIGNIFDIKDNDSCYTIIHHDSFFTYVMLDYNYLSIENKNELNMYQKRLDNNKEQEFYSDNNIVFADEGFIFYPLKVRDVVTEKQDGSLILNIPNSIIHRNKFLFNSNNASLTWLINNDVFFLEILVKEFGYDKNEKINRLILQKAFKKLEKYNDISSAGYNLFARKKDCSSKVDIREGLLKTILNTDDTNSEGLYLAYNYALYLIDLNNIESFTKDERFKIVSYLGYYIQLVYDKIEVIPETWYPGSFLRNELVGNKELLKHIESNNYYNLPNFEDMIADILGQIEVQSEEYNRNHFLDLIN